MALTWEILRPEQLDIWVAVWSELQEQLAKASPGAAGQDADVERILNDMNVIVHSAMMGLPRQWGCDVGSLPDEHRKFLMSLPIPRGFKREFSGGRNDYLVQFSVPRGPDARRPEFFLPGETGNEPILSYKRQSFLRAIEQHVPDVLEDLHSRCSFPLGPRSDPRIHREHEKLWETIRNHWREPEAILPRGKAGLEEWAEKFFLQEVSETDRWVLQTARATLREWTGSLLTGKRATMTGRPIWSLSSKPGLAPSSPPTPPLPHDLQITVSLSDSWAPTWESRKLVEARLQAKFKTALTAELERVAELHSQRGFRPTTEIPLTVTPSLQEHSKYLALFQCGEMGFGELAELFPSGRGRIPAAEPASRSHRREGTIQKASSKLAADIGLQLRH